MRVLKNNKLKRILPILILGLFSIISNAQTIKGKVTDIITGEPLIGAAVKLGGTKYVAFVKLDGTFSFPKVAPSTYNAIITFEGYNKEISTTPITVADGQTKEIDFTMLPQSTELKTVTINADRGGDKGARHLEKKADHLLNVLSAKTIQLLPDITVANALQRVSGVTIERNSAGEARYQRKSLSAGFPPVRSPESFGQ